MNIKFDSLEKRIPVIEKMISKYEGEYVAIIGDKIIAHGKDVKKVYQDAKSKFPKNIVFLGQVPRKGDFDSLKKCFRFARENS